jgi:hypothetical protein
MKPREYCCCAIPLVNIGIYATIAEQAVLAIVVGTLALATPSSLPLSFHAFVSIADLAPTVVGAATPAIAPWILAITSYIVAGFQVFGFLGVAKVRRLRISNITSIFGLNYCLGEYNHVSSICHTAYSVDRCSILCCPGLDHLVGYGSFNR